MPPDELSATPPADPVTAPPAERMRLVAFAALTAGFVALCVVVAVPFLPAVTWGVALAVIAWPLHRWVGRHVGRPAVAAALTTLAVVVFILGPGVFVAYQLAREATAAADQAREAADGGVREYAGRVPGGGELVAWVDRLGLDVEAEVRKGVEAYTRDLSGLAQGSVAAVIQFLAAVYILYYLLRDRGEFRQGLRDFLPLTRGEADRVAARAADSVHANLYATLVTSLIDAVGGGLMFWWLGLPAPLLWGVVIFVLSVLPVVGAGLVWFPAAVYLAAGGRWAGAAALLAWGLLSFLIVDNVIYVRIAGDRMRVHEVPALVAFLGGLAVFGLSGMILGPAVLAVTIAFLEVWRGRLARADSRAPAPTGTMPG